MHMADALVSPAVGGTMIAASAGILGYALYRTRHEDDNRTASLAGVLGAFIFAAQMINFAIPATGSSGHLGGALFLAVLLKPFRAFIVMAAILLLQALLFADGGLLAYGCNVFNMAFFACFIAYPLIFKPIIRNSPSSKKLMIASVLSALICIELGAFAVVVETFCSGIVQLPFGVFAALMLPIHLAIGLAEGVATGVILSFLYRYRPEMFQENNQSVEPKACFGLAVGALIMAGGLSLIASEQPDGLEWSILKTAGDSFELPASLQAVFADYLIANSTALAGVVGVLITASVIFALIKAVCKKKAPST